MKKFDCVTDAIRYVKEERAAIVFNLFVYYKGLIIFVIDNKTIDDFIDGGYISLALDSTPCYVSEKKSPLSRELTITAEVRN